MASNQHTVEQPRTILFCYAHPDDESFGPGGTIARYADAGVEIVLVCATLGEAGKAGDPPICTPEELPQVRRQELMAATAVLGISRVELLGYHDKKLDQVPFAEGVDRIVQMILKYRPEVVVTFPPGGISGHPDHVVINGWTIEALRQIHQRFSGSREGLLPRLYYNTAPEFFRVFKMDPPHPFDSLVNVRVEVGPWIQRKIEALRCHRSQHLSVDRLLSAMQKGDKQSDQFLWESYLHVDVASGQVATPPSDVSLLVPPVD